MTKTYATKTTPDRSAIRTLTAILVAAVVTTTLAALAGIGLVVAEPASGSATEAVLGFTAAGSGLLTAALVVGAAIYAQSRNLWRFAPTWIRVTVLGLIAVAVVRSIIVSLA
jgi:hypothetical protein